MKSAAILIAALLIAQPAPVLAGSTCGSSGGGGGSSSDSSSSSSSSDDSSSYSSSSSSSSSTPICRDSTDIVGYRECTRFGAWAGNLKLPAVIIELGTTMRAARSLAGNQRGTVSHATESFAYRTVDAAEPGFDHQVVTTLRLGAVITRGIFLALDFEGGPIMRGKTRTEMTGSGVFGSPTLTQGRGLAFNMALVTGIRRTIGRGRLGVEVAGGVRSSQYSFTSSYHNCVTTETVGDAAPLLEARAAYEHWLHPFISVGGTLGASMIERGSVMGGLHMGFHTRAFGGSR